MNTAAQPSYKLTKYPLGSMAELWSISWPLMLGLLSASLMMFVNRLILGRYSSDALNAAASAGMVFWTFTIIPLICASICEVLVGRSNGANSPKKVGPYVWQMLWMSLAATPLFLLGAWLAPQFIFAGSYNIALETSYFRSFMILGPFFCTTVALIGFFVGLGSVTIVTVSTVIGNLLNIALDFIFIFGFGPIAPLGIHGAALATGISQIVQTGLMLTLFLNRRNRLLYNTADYSFNWPYLKESLQIGLPAGIGKFLEILGHCIFFRIAINSGPDNFTIISITQSIYLLLSFLVEGLSKGVSAIVANLLGAQQYQYIKNVLHAALKIHTLIALVLGSILVVLFPHLFGLFFGAADTHILTNPVLMVIAKRVFYMLIAFFLIDGFGWMYMGLLTAAGDTKFLLYASSLLNVVAYILPTYIVIGRWHAPADKGWMVVIAYSLIVLLTYIYRYRSNQWLKNFKAEHLQNSTAKN